ncbi:c-type cytochrome [Candidatus Sulfurimonas marisnigri]|uniref:C-type cytochrome n=1 Tax=Candidatus Sulfurimonas marisnigri TaxID=2740405 RepID=A0A7S7M1J5_9BACT|nr:c-type cytochrome [Candidatus Sulfurimonas marisnigri]QOY55315.1 c-type cytochrome [Candidatus Sulfurimonas marisnigri]
MKKIVGLIIASSLSLLAVESNEVFKSCVMCHGSKGEKKALNSSTQLITMSEEVLFSKLKNIVDGSSSMSKMYIKMHRTKLRTVCGDEDIATLSNYIFKLK